VQTPAPQQDLGVSSPTNLQSNDRTATLASSTFPVAPVATTLPTSHSTIEQPRTHADRPHYDFVDRSDYYLAYKRRRGIVGAIPVLISQGPCQPAPEVPNTHEFPNMANIFSAFITLPHEMVSTSIHAYSIVDNKADTLTQS